MAAKITVNGKTYTVTASNEKTPEPETKTVVVGVSRDSSGRTTGAERINVSQQQAKRLSEKTSREGRQTVTKTSEKNYSVKPSKKTVVVGVSRDSSGRTTSAQNLRLSQEDAKRVSRLTEKQGRLTARSDGSTVEFTSQQNKKSSISQSSSASQPSPKVPPLLNLYSAQNPKVIVSDYARYNQPIAPEDSYRVSTYSGTYLTYPLSEAQKQKNRERASIGNKIKEGLSYGASQGGVIGVVAKTGQVTMRIAEDLVASPVRGAVKLTPGYTGAKIIRDSIRGDLSTETLRYNQQDKKDIRSAAVTGGLIIGGVGVLGKAAKTATDATLVYFGVKGVKTAIEKPYPLTITYGVIGASFAVGGSKGLIKEGIKKAKFSRSTNVNPETIFSDQVLQGKQKFPTSKSSQEIINLFEKTKDVEGNVYGVTATPSSLKGRVFGESRKSQTGFEDPGAYFSALGEGSPAFLGITKEGGSFNFNPLSSGVSIPRAVIAKAKGVIFPSKTAVETPGFTGIRSFQESVKDAGYFVITKRGMKGKGEVSDTTIKGTGESEVVGVKGQEFAYTDSSNFLFPKKTTYKGETVGVQYIELVSKRDLNSLQLAKNKFRRSSIGEQTDSFLYSSVNPRTIRIGGFSSSSTVNSVPKATVSISPFSSSTVSRSSSAGASGYDLGRSFVPPSSSGSVLSSSVVPSSLVVSMLSSSPSVSTSTISTTSSGGSRSGSSSGRSSSASVSSPLPSSSSAPSSSLSSISGGSSISSISGSSRASSRSSSTLFTRGTIYNRPRIRNNNNRGSFAVFVRRRGIFQQRGILGSGSEAFSKGLNIVRGSAAASFKVINLRSGSAYSQQLPGSFRVSKKEKGVFIERRESRIKSSGELQDITFKGIRSSKQKTVKKRKSFKGLFKK